MSMASKFIQKKENFCMFRLKYEYLCILRRTFGLKGGYGRLGFCLAGVIPVQPAGKKLKKEEA
jgi:hypothetical protein